MSKLNSVIRLLSFAIATVNFIFGVCLFAVSTDLYLKSWLKFTPNYFKTWIVYIICCGVFLVPITAFGCIGTIKQDHYEVRKTGRVMLMVFQGLLFLGMVTCGAIGVNLRETADSLETGAEISYTANGTYGMEVQLQYDWFETVLKEKFDGMYFQTCSGASSELSWYFLREQIVCSDMTLYSTECQEGCAISDDECQETFETDCCPSESICATGDVRYCPYDRCRKQLNLFFMRKIRPLANYMLALVAFQILHYILICMLVCYYPADDLEQQLIKAGTIKKPKEEVTTVKHRKTKTSMESSQRKSFVDANEKGRLSPGGTHLEFFSSDGSEYKVDHIEKINEKLSEALGNFRPEKINEALGNLRPEKINDALGNLKPTKLNEALGNVTKSLDFHVLHGKKVKGAQISESVATASSRGTLRLRAFGLRSKGSRVNDQDEKDDDEGKISDIINI
mmetsp:Transcript_35981/g.46230  ORF Transcript_35981/g.46230 Transcript_35981/m.46230 type:complete len:452 (+) Transcript_35981:92-1447(+)